MKSVFVLALTISVGTLAFAQPPDTLWTRTYHEMSATEFNSVCALPDGGCAATGHCCVNLYHGFYASVYAARVDAQGTTVWEHNYWLVWGNIDAPYAEGFDIQPLSGGGLIVGTGANGWPPFGARLLRLNSDGETQWFTYCDPDVGDPFLEITSVCTAASGGFAATLHSDYDSARVVRVDSNGQILWRRSATDRVLRSILPLSDGGLMVAGGPGFFLERLNSAGDTVWTRLFNLNPASECMRLITRPEGGYLMLGGGGPGSGRVATVSDDGELVASRLYDFSPNFIAGAPCAEGGAILLSDRLVRINDSGDTLWTRALPCDSCACRSIAQTTDSGYVVAGSTHSYWGDAYLVKFAREGLGAGDHFVLHPSSFSLAAFPNPFNPTTTLSFTLPRAGKTKIVIYDITGREVRTLSDQAFEAGEHQIHFDGSALPSGIYFAQMTSGEFVATQKLLLLK